MRCEQYCKADSLRIERAPLQQPDGVIYTPKVLYVGSILLTGTQVVPFSDVIDKSPGAVFSVCNPALPLVHFHERRNQKHFSRFRVPPVLNNNFSHSYANACKLEINLEVSVYGGCSMLSFLSSLLLVPSPVSSTNASPKNSSVA